ncbi:hypothetical protein EDC01DRAFT_627986 [Geopyxis carbonaria]|nr:hypothetical protein EDC01DRAFT_627986 [Geopyxis carbonaria]
MASARPAPVTIHRDVLGPFSTSPLPSPAMAGFQSNSRASTTTSASPPASALHSSGANLATGSILFRPPILGPSASPSKRKQQQQKPSSCPTSVFQNSFDRISMLPPETDAFTTDSPMKKPPVTVFDTSIHMPSLHRKPHKAFFTQFHASKAALNEKENYGHLDMLAGKVQKSIPRRPLMEAAPIREKKVLREKPANNSSAPEPATWGLPEILDDGKKPAHSYATLIGMAILRAPDRRLTLAQIYKWIGDTFKFYRSSNNGWQNSIRHNLSLNKAFIKQERPKGDPGKGNYWVIQKGFEHQFMKNKSSRKASGSKKSKSQPPPPSPTPMPRAIKKEPIPEIEIHVDESELPTSIHDGSTDTLEENTSDKYVVDELLQLSSDATRSAGSVSPEPPHIPEDDDVFRPSSPHLNIPAHSSPPHMCSSPPLTRAQLSQSLREGTPPSLMPSSGLRKRKLSSMNDSGYFSSLDSSVLRPTIMEDKPRIKRGRAEEDIARIRQPPHESPTRRSTIAGNASNSFLASSPYRSLDPNPMLPPLTPATTLCPKKPPRSISPNTNLKLHRDRIRQMVKSPSRDIDILDDNPWSSTLAALACSDFAGNDSGHDEIEDLLKNACYGSPEREVQKSDVIKNYNKNPDIFNDGFFDTPDFFGVDVFGVTKNGFERFTNDCPESPTTGASRGMLHRSHTTNF